MQFTPVTFKDIIKEASKTPFVTPEKLTIFNRSVQALETNVNILRSHPIMEGIKSGWERYVKGEITSTTLINLYKALIESAIDIIDGKFKDNTTLTSVWRPTAGWHPWLNLTTNYANTASLAPEPPDKYQARLLCMSTSKLFTELVARVQIAYSIIPEITEGNDSMLYNFKNTTRNMSALVRNPPKAELIVHNYEPGKHATTGLTLTIREQNDGSFHLTLEASAADKAKYDMGLPYRVAEARRHDEAHAKVMKEPVIYTLTSSWKLS